MYQLKVVAEIRKQRLIRGFSQENMASELGVSVRTYSKLERGQTALTVNRLFEIAINNESVSLHFSARAREVLDS